MDLSTVTTTRAPCSAKLQTRQQQSSKIMDELATPEQIHGGQFGVVLSGYSHVSMPDMLSESQLVPRNSAFLSAAVLKNHGRQKERNPNVPFMQWYQSREGCYHVAAIENLVPGVYSRPVNMYTVSQELRFLSLGERLQED